MYRARRPAWSPTSNDELAERPLEATTLSLTGIGALWLKLLDYIVTSQIQGFLLAFSIIAVR